MSAASIFFSLAAVIVVGIILITLYLRRDPERVVEAAIDEVVQTVPEARAQAFRRALARIEDRLAADKARLDRIVKRLAYLARTGLDESASFIAEHRRALGRWLLVFDAAAQIGITLVQRPELAWYWAGLVGLGLAMVYAFIGIITTWVVILVFRRRPQRGWFYLDITALLSGSLAVAAALALLLARGVTDPATASFIENTMGSIGGPLIVWGGFAAGLLSGVAYHQDEEFRLGDDKRRRERRVAVWEEGLKKLRDLGDEFGLTVLILVLVIGASRRTVEAQASHVTPAVALSSSGPACVIVKDGSNSPDVSEFSMAIDSGLSVGVERAVQAHCRRLLAMVASGDTVWAARKWFDLFDLPDAGLDSARCSSMQAPPARGPWAAAYRAISPSATVGDKKQAADACRLRSDSLHRSRVALMAAIVKKISAFFATAKPLGTLDTTAIFEMVAFAGSSRFVEGTIITDAIETKVKGPIPHLTLGNGNVLMVVSPTGAKYGGREQSIIAARELADHVTGLRVIPYTDVSSTRPGVDGLTKTLTITNSNGQIVRP